MDTFTIECDSEDGLYIARIKSGRTVVAIGKAGTKVEALCNLKYDAKYVGRRMFEIASEVEDMRKAEWRKQQESGVEEQQ